jgi:signal transduction histidine kinase
MRVPTTLRVALLSAMLALASNLALIGFIHFRTHDDAMEALHQRVVEDASVLRDVYGSGGLAPLEDAIDDTLSAGDPELVEAILGPAGQRERGNAELAPPAPRLKPGYQTGLLRVEGTNAPVEAGYILRPLGRGAWLLSGRSFGERLALQRTLERSLWLAIAIALLLGLLCGIITARYVGRRVAAISAVADSITGGDLSRRVPLGGSGDAFDGLGLQINRMLDRIGALMEELRLLTDCLAHDLRSPVGRLRARVDAAMEATDEKRRQSLLAGVLNEADSLMRILTTVLEIGRSEAMTSRNQFAWLDPRELVAELAEMYEPLAEDAGAALSLETGPVLLPLFGHRQLLAQALSNLVDNAINHAAAGGEILIFARDEEGLLRLGVADRGPGIKDSEQAEARRRFGRLDSSRSTAGAGLGLALAQAVAHLHHGRLDLDDNCPGLVASIVLPARGVSEAP